MHFGKLYISRMHITCSSDAVAGPPARAPGTCIQRMPPCGIGHNDMRCYNNPLYLMACIRRGSHDSQAMNSQVHTRSAKHSKFF